MPPTPFPDRAQRDPGNLGDLGHLAVEQALRGQGTRSIRRFLRVHENIV